MVYVLAEIGVNHNGSVALARELVDIAVRSGADGVKFQTFKSTKLAVPTAEKADYQKANTKDGDTQVEMLQRLELSEDDFRGIKELCSKKGIDFISTPFDLESADFLNSIGVHTFKIGSGDLTNFPLLKRVGSFGKKVILSTGMGSMAEVEAGVHHLRKNGCGEIVVLHCVSCYPTRHEDLNLRCIQTMREKLGVAVGFSDHTVDYKASLYSICLGAAYIEKHFTKDKSMVGPDHQASLDPGELNEFVSLIRECEAILGDGVKRCRNAELNTRRAARRSLYFSRTMLAGETIGEADLSALRPNVGICPSEAEAFVGRTLKSDVRMYTPLSRDHV
tara:strand:+ start:978 stop:1979 length:1002 start_codon:yes stop_codon:yes gene_type:complete